MTFDYIPHGVCSKKMIFEIENNTVLDLRVEGGCSGNLQGISSLIKGLPVDEVIEKLSGIRCGKKLSSCPAQIAKALKQFKKSAHH